MSQTKREYEEWQEREELNSFLIPLVENEYLENPALGITKQVIDKGRESLSEKQEYVFRKQAMEQYVREECYFCGLDIPFCEMFDALENGGWCGYCLHKRSKWSRE